MFRPSLINVGQIVTKFAAEDGHPQNANAIENPSLLDGKEP